MSKILVTGAGGFIGFHLSNYLSELGYDVTGIDIHFPAEDVKEFRFQKITGDFRNRELIQEIIKEKEYIFHLASAHLQVSLDEKEYWDINVHSLRPFLEIAKMNKVKCFIHVSSVGIYGNLKKWPADEESELIPQSIYGETKLAGEKEVNKFYQETGFPVVIIRPAWVFGEGCPRTKKIYYALKKKKFIMIGKGENLRHPIYLADMLNAFKLSMEKVEAIGKTFLIGGQKAITANELVSAFCKVFNFTPPSIRIPYSLGKFLAIASEKTFGIIKKEPPISTRTLEFFDTNNSFDISNAREVLGFNPAFSFEEGLNDCKGWLVKNG